jgi:hypothetical protein
MRDFKAPLGDKGCFKGIVLGMPISALLWCLLGFVVWVASTF